MECAPSNHHLAHAACYVSRGRQVLRTMDPRSSSRVDGRTCPIRLLAEFAAAPAGRRPHQPSLAATDFAHTASEFAAQQETQRNPFGITDFGGDLIDARLAGLEQVHCALYP